MGILRSEEMQYFTMLLPLESAWHLMNYLGRIHALQFIDMNKSDKVFSRSQASYIMLCDEIERRLRFI